MLYHTRVRTFEVVESKGKVEVYDYLERSLIGTFDNYEKAVEMIQTVEKFDYLQTELMKIWASLYWLNRWYPKKIEKEFLKVSELKDNLPKLTEQDTVENIKRKIEQVEDALMEAQKIYDQANERVKIPS